MSVTNTYEKFHRENWGIQFNKSDDMIMYLGLAGETGEVMELVKKNLRGVNAIPLDDVDLMMELSDVLAYTTKIAHRHGYSIDDLMNAWMIKMKSRHSDIGKNKFIEKERVIDYLNE